MTPEIVAGLIIMVLTVIVVSLLIRLVEWLMALQAHLGEFIAGGRGGILRTLFAIVLYIPLTIFSVVIIIISALCAISLAKDAVKWLNK